MPQAQNLVVKNGAATPVDKTFVLMSPAAGDGGLAEWVLKEGTISVAFPVFTAMATKTGNGARNLKLKLKMPSSYTSPVTGLTNVGSNADFNVSLTIPNTYPEALKDDFTAFAVNLLTTSLVKAMIRDAISAT